MKTLYNKFDKKLIPDLPRVVFPGRIEVVVSENVADRAVDYLLSQPILGFDTETRPSFKKGELHKVCLLQVSTPEVCFLFRLNHMGIPDSIVRLLSDKSVVKVGLSWHDDLSQLLRRRKFTPGTFVDLQHLARELHIEDMSLQKLYANVFGERIAKGQQMSNWEADSLSDSQKQYAAIDAWACIRIYQELQRVKQEGYQLVVAPQPVKETEQ